MRRANGTGTVYKRRDVKRRKPWIAVINLGWDSNGHRKKKIIGSFETAVQAQQALEAYNITPEKFSDTTITIGDVWEAVKADRERQGKPIPPLYFSYWRNHVSKIARLPIAEVKALHLQQAIDGANVGHAAQQAMLTILHGIYNYALANDLVSKNYSNFINISKTEKSNKHKSFTTAEMRIFWENCNTDTVKLLLIQIYTGMRQGELSGMEIKNVHLKDRYMIGGSKTEAGINRIIPIAECILPFVRHFYTISKFAKFPYLVMPDKSRKLSLYRGKANIRRIFKSTTDTLCTIDHSSHDARHTFATLCSNYGVDEYLTKRIIGHTTTGNITQSIYTHKTAVQFIEAVNKLPYGNTMFLSPEEEAEHMKNGSQLVATN